MKKWVFSVSAVMAVLCFTWTALADEPPPKPHPASKHAPGWTLAPAIFESTPTLDKNVVEGGDTITIKDVRFIKNSDEMNEAKIDQQPDKLRIKAVYLDDPTHPEVKDVDLDGSPITFVTKKWTGDTPGKLAITLSAVGIGLDGKEVAMRDEDQKSLTVELRKSRTPEEEKAAAEKKAADEKAAIEKKAADDKAAIEKKAADDKAAADKKAADGKPSDDKAGADSKPTLVVELSPNPVPFDKAELKVTWSYKAKAADKQEDGLKLLIVEGKSTAAVSTSSTFTLPINHKPDRDAKQLTFLVRNSKGEDLASLKLTLVVEGQPSDQPDVNDESLFLPGRKQSYDFDNPTQAKLKAGIIPSGPTNGMVHELGPDGKPTGKLVPRPNKK